MKPASFLIFALCLVFSSLIDALSSKDIDTEAELLGSISNLRNQHQDSPAGKLEKLKILHAHAIESQWQTAALQSKILKAQLYIDARDYAAAHSALEKISDYDEYLLSDNDAIKVQLIKLRLSDNAKGVDDIRLLIDALLTVVNNIQDEILRSTVLQRVGESLFRLEAYGDAIKYLSQAYDISKQQGDTHGIINQLNSLAGIYTVQKDYETAVRYYMLAYEQVITTDNAYQRSILEYNIGFNQASNGNSEEAEKYFVKAITSGEIANFEAIGIYARQQLGILKLNEGEFQETIDLNQEAFRFYAQSNDNVRQFFTVKVMAEAALGLEDFDAVDRYLKIGEELVSGLNMPGRQVEYNQLLADVLYKKGQYQQAFDTLNDNVALQQSIFEQDQEKQAQKLKIEFDTELVKSQNAALKESEQLNKTVIQAQMQKERILSLLIAISALCFCLVVWILVKQIRVRNKFKKMAFIDTLTNSPNRRAILTEAKQAFIEVKAGISQSLWIAIIDIDFFKKINDQHGHDVGDRVLYAFANACRNSLLEGQHFGRFGGEEWLLVLSKGTEKELSLIFDSIRNKINTVNVRGLPDGHEITFSIGAASFDVNKDAKVNDIIARADAQLYVAKASGRDQIRVADTL